MKKIGLTIGAALAALLLLPSGASAHVLPGDPQSFHDGFLHPLTGLDHLLAMVAVGLWATQQRGRAVWLIPLTFVGVMVLGGAMGLAGATMPGSSHHFAEWVIAASVLVLGTLIATVARFHPSLAMIVVGFFALFHGYAHGHEMPASAGALGFSLGFVCATLALHAAGMGLGFAIKNQRAVRFAGAAIALSSIGFLLNIGQ